MTSGGLREAGPPSEVLEAKDGTVPADAQRACARESGSATIACRKI
jgi:hypothetical protein